MLRILLLNRRVIINYTNILFRSKYTLYMKVKDCFPNLSMLIFTMAPKSGYERIKTLHSNNKTLYSMTRKKNSVAHVLTHTPFNIINF